MRAAGSPRGFYSRPHGQHEKRIGAEHSLTGDNHHHIRRDLDCADAAIAEPARSGEAACPATVAFHETRAVSIAGAVAVADMVLNRVDDRRLRDTVCGVIRQRGRFASMAHPHSASGKTREPRAWNRALAIAMLRYLGALPPQFDGALFFCNP
jgi:spore germination cell wall hydrolase CwlJ-like protein